MVDPLTDLAESTTTLAQVVIEAQGLTKRFGDRLAVDRLDLDIRHGEVFGFLGPNGAGKSTLIRMLVGLLDPSAGSARVLGHDIPRESEALSRHLGYMTQRFSLYRDLSIEENLEFAGEIFGFDRAERRRRIDRALEEYGLGERRDQRPATLSGGWRQRLALAVATLHRPRILLLDEPTAGVDPESRREFWTLLFELASEGTTILVSTHYMDEAIRCHRLCLIRRGRRAALGTPTQLRTSLDGRVVELIAKPYHDAIDRLSRRREVVSVTQLGNRIHVLLAEGEDSTRVAEVLAADLRDAGLRKVHAVPAEPDLEDVFVALHYGERLPGAAEPAP